MAERVYCLYRVSTTKQVDHDDRNQADIPVQRKACRDFAEKMGWTIIKELQENGVSGFKVSASDRDQIQIIKEHAQQKKFDILLVFMFDRLGRKADETPFVVSGLSKLGIKVWSVNEGEQRFDSHIDNLLNYIRFWQADGESQKTSMRTRAAMSQMVQEGRYRGGAVPYGYRLEKTGRLNKRKHEISELVIDEDEARIVRQMYNLCVSFGYGRWRIAMLLNEQGIKNRAGENWHDSSVGRILHSAAYLGILKNGETQSEPIEELRIIDQHTFDLAQEVMAQRTVEAVEARTLPLNTTGQSLLSGNVFCAHCGGRLVLTTNGTVRVDAAGRRIGRKRIRYVCYNKTRRRMECDGQTGYTMRILDDKIIEVVHQIFDKMKGIPQSDIVNRVQCNAMAALDAELKRVRAEYGSAVKKYDAMKAEVAKAVQGESAFDLDVLSELVKDAKEKMLQASDHLSQLSADAENQQNRMEQIQAEYQRLLEWSDIFDDSDIAVKKMVVGYLIKRVEVGAGYRLHIEMNINFEQFNIGLDELADVEELTELPLAQ